MRLNVKTRGLLQNGGSSNGGKIKVAKNGFVDAV
jgi:hypothetical protein